MKNLLFDTLQFSIVSSARIIAAFTWPDTDINQKEENSNRAWIISTITGLSASFLMLVVAYDRVWQQATMSQHRNMPYLWFWFRILLMGTLVSTVTYGTDKLIDFGLGKVREEDYIIKSDNLILLTGIVSGSLFLFLKHLMFPVRQSSLIEGISTIGKSVKNYCGRLFWHQETEQPVPTLSLPSSNNSTDITPF